MVNRIAEYRLDGGLDRMCHGLFGAADHEYAMNDLFPVLRGGLLVWVLKFDVVFHPAFEIIGVVPPLVKCVCGRSNFEVAVSKLLVVWERILIPSQLI